jgi:hypothetical protein
LASTPGEQASEGAEREVRLPCVPAHLKPGKGCSIAALGCHHTRCAKGRAHGSAGQDSERQRGQRTPHRIQEAIQLFLPSANLNEDQAASCYPLLQPVSKPGRAGEACSHSGTRRERVEGITGRRRRAATQARSDRDGEADRGEAGGHIDGVNLAHLPPESVAIVAHVPA